MGQRLGYGSYERQNGEQSKEDLRNRFFAAITEHAKHVLKNLYDESFKLYLDAGLGFKVDANKVMLEGLNPNEQARKLAREWNRHRWNRPQWQRHFETGPITYDKRKEKFRQSLFEWSRRFNLNAAWCREYAYETLDHWSHAHPDHEHLSFELHLVARTVFAVKRDVEWFVFKRRVQHPQLLPIETIKARLREAFECDLRQYFTQLEAIAENQGYVPTPEIYEAHKSKLEDRLRWLVERIIYNKTYKAITDELGIKGNDYLDESYIRQTITSLAKRIGLSSSTFYRR